MNGTAFYDDIRNPSIFASLLPTLYLAGSACSLLPIRTHEVCDREKERCDGDARLVSYQHE